MPAATGLNRSSLARQKTSAVAMAASSRLVMCAIGAEYRVTGSPRASERTKSVRRVKVVNGR